jgi:hypothetical protein
MAVGLKAPRNLRIDFSPSSKQYELWKLLQPDCCPHCGGHIEQRFIGNDLKGNPQYKPYCSSCGSTDLPQLILGGGAAGGGKCCKSDSYVCTPFGFRQLKDLKVGDIISNPTNGGQQRILRIHPKGTFPFYRIHFIDGTYTDCSEGHLWRLHKSRGKSKKAKAHPEQFAEQGDDRIWETIGIYEWYQRKKQGMYKGYSLIIPLTKPVQFTVGNTNLPIEPYILGAIIGDGCISDTYLSQGVVQMTTMDTEIRDRFIKAGYDMSHTQRKSGNQSTQYFIHDRQLVESLNKLDIAGNKSKDHFIPRQYLLAPIEDRLELMKGLMDTDGYIDSRGHMSYTSISKQLAEDVAFIVRSLGGIATITQNKAGYKNEAGEFIQCNDAYDVQIRIEELAPEFFGLAHKKERARLTFNGGVSKLGKRITDVEYIGEQESFCITVDDPSGLYITDNFTVTHNSYLGSCWLVSSCMRFPDIRAVVARKTLKSLKGSTFNTIKKVCKSWGLVEGVHYKINNVENFMTFWNDSTIIMQEMVDKPGDPNFERFGSSEYTIAFIDEVSEISERAVEVLFSRLRWRTTETFKTARMMMSTNPCLTWVRSRFVQDEDGNPVLCKEGEAYVPFSVFDNPDKAFVQTYVAALNKIKDKATRERLLYGNWDFVDSNEMAAYWNFDGEKHLVEGLRESVYNPLNPIISGWDFNVAPYMSELEFQIDYAKKEIYVLEENLGRPEHKENNTPSLAKKIREKHLYNQHVGGIIVTGDPAGLARSTQTEDGVNNYTIITDNMKSSVLRPHVKLLSKQPPQITRLEFVNAIFNGYDGWKIKIDMRCRKFTEDMIYQKKNSDGTKCKAKVMNPKTGTKEERYGHLSDILDYVLILFLNDSWRRFQNQTTSIETYTAPVYNTFEY